MSDIDFADTLPCSCDEFIADCEWHGYTTRVVKEDGRYFIVTRDYDSDRMNLEIEQGNVVRAYVG